MKRWYPLLALIVSLSIISIKETQAQPYPFPCSQCGLVSNLTATNITNTSITLTWSHPGSQCGFIITVRDNSNGNVTSYTMSNPNPNGNTFTVTGLSPVTYYTFWVRQIHTPPPGTPELSCVEDELTVSTGGDGIGCDCDIVSNLNINNITGTTADVNWLSNATCQDFYVTVTDMNNTANSVTYTVLGSTNYTITGLTPGGHYQVSVRVISSGNPGQSCVDETIHFFADPTPDCGPCVVPTNLTVQNITQSSALVSWMPGSSCNDFEVWVQDNVSGTSQVYNVIGNSLNITGLLPSRSYTVFVAMKSNAVPGLSCLHADITFTTLHCGNFTQSLTHYVQTLIYGNPGSNSIVYNVQQPYISSNSSFNFAQGSVSQFAFDHICQSNTPSGTVFANVWFDFNNDGVFSPSEKVTHFQFTYGGGASFISRAALNTSSSSCGPCSFTAPNQTYNNIKGRCIISFNDAGPCGPVTNGQVLDFLVNIQ